MKWDNCDPDCSVWDTLDFWWNEMVVDAYSWLLPGEWGVILVIGGGILFAFFTSAFVVGVVFDGGGRR